jgi:uncharacterized RDD family membrane protein YckC
MASRINMKPVGISRRLFAFILDGFIFFCFLGAIHISLGYQSTFFLESELPDRLWYPYLILALAYLFDQIICPVLLGLTFSRWICGYRIKRKDGRNPSLIHSIVRFLSIWLIEFLTIGILTFITAPFRKDKATIHDIISRTYAVFPAARQKLRLTRSALLGVFLILGALFFLNIVTYAIHDIFVKPQKEKALSSGLPEGCRFILRYAQTLTSCQRRRWS